MIRPAMRLAAGTLALLLLVAGCGQKGALYLPDKTRKPVPAQGSAAPPPAPAPAQTPAPQPAATPAPPSGGGGS